MIILAFILLLFAAIIAITISRDLGLFLAFLAVVLILLVVFAGVDFH